MLGGFSKKQFRTFDIIGVSVLYLQVYAVHKHKVYGNITKIMILKQSNRTVVYAINAAEP